MDPLQVVSTIESANRHLDPRDELFKSALIAGDAARLQIILEEKPRLKRVTGEMLWHAVTNDQPRVASMLLDAGVDPNVRKISEERRSTILHELVKKRYDGLALFAMTRGAKVCARDEDGKTPLDHAVRKKSSIDVIRELVKRGARVYVNHVCDSADHPDVDELVALLLAGLGDAETMASNFGGILYYCGCDIFHDIQILPVVKVLMGMEQLVEQTRIDRGILRNAILSDKFEMAQLLIDQGFHMIGMLDYPEDASEITRHVKHLRDEKIIKYLALTIVKGKPINDSDLKIIRDHTRMRTYHAQCLDELNKMKTMKFMNNFTFFSVLKNAKVMPFHTRNPTIPEKYREVESKGEFPIYKQEIIFAIHNASMRKHSLREREKAISQSLKNYLPFIPLEKIIYHFYLNEVK